MSYFEDVQNFNAESYADLFANAPNELGDLIAARKLDLAGDRL